MTSTMLENIAKAMVSSKVRPSSVMAGYTYLGQLIAHDIVPRTNPPQGTNRLVNSSLNLDSLYGQNNDFLNTQGKFSFDYPESAVTDFKRIETSGMYVAHIAEPRNDENIIVAQLQIFWQKLHNLILNDGYAANPEQAKKLTVQTYQLVIVEDFLRQIMDRKIYQYFFQFNKRCILDRNKFNWSTGKLPDFFSNASFRFGHSIIRENYRIRSGSDAISIDKLFLRGRKLTTSNEIQWRFFFGDKDPKANLFDTNIVNPMTKVPKDSGVPPPHHVPKLNLIAGKNIIGVDFIGKFMQQRNWSILSNSLGLKTQLSQSHINGSSLVGSGVSISDLPLWPYILLEAQVFSNGKYLGPLGSILNAEVLKTSIQSSEYSIYHTTENIEEYNLQETLQKMGSWGALLKSRIPLEDEPHRIMPTLITLVK